MANIKAKIANLLPQKLVAAIRPYSQMINRRLFRSGFDQASNVSIETFDQFEIAYRSGTADEKVIEHSFSNDIFFQTMSAYRPKIGDVIIEVGAHIGTFSLLAATKIGDTGKLYAIEASQDTYNFLRINTALNQASNLSAHHLALADQEGTVPLYHNIGNWGHSTVSKLSTITETVPAMSLSTFMQRNNITRCNFMKLNCEGAEFPILLATPRNVLQKIETMLIYYHCDLWEGSNEQALIDYLETNGFRCTLHPRSATRGHMIAYRNLTPETQL